MNIRRYLSKRSMASVYADGYSNFGWQMDGTTEQPGKMDSISMKFKRDHKIRNKAELTRLQRNFDSLRIGNFNAGILQIYYGLCGSLCCGDYWYGFMAGSVFSITANDTFHALSLLFPLFQVGCFPISSTGAL